MIIMRAVFSVIAGMLMLATLISPSASAKSLNSVMGEWHGVYVSAGGGDVNAFTLTFEGSPSSLTGSVVELNAFGDSNQALFLTSDLYGSLSGRTVSFTKVYDGSGGVSHSVVYEGTLSGDGRRIQGTYYLNGAAAGRFELAR